MRTADLLQDVMDRDYIGVIKKKLDDMYRNAGIIGATGRGDRAERENRITCLVRNCWLSGLMKVDRTMQILLNDLDISSTHMERLLNDLITHPSVSQHYTDNEYTSVKSTISSLSGIVPKLRSTLRVNRSASWV
jgi:hypothetical protein